MDSAKEQELSRDAFIRVYDAADDRARKDAMIILSLHPRRTVVRTLEDALERKGCTVKELSRVSGAYVKTILQDRDNLTMEQMQRMVAFLNLDRDEATRIFFS